MEQDTREWARRCAERPGAEWRMETRKEGERVQFRNEGTFDELVVDHWLHIEQLDERAWWMRIGDARVEVLIAEDGGVTVNVERDSY